MSIGLDAAPASLANKVAAGAAGLVLLVAVLAAGAGAGVTSLLGGGDATPSVTATDDIPTAMLTLYQEAATTCPGLPWTVLAAIGTVECPPTANPPFPACTPGRTRPAPKLSAGRDFLAGT